MKLTEQTIKLEDIKEKLTVSNKIIDLNCQLFCELKKSTFHWS